MAVILEVRVIPRARANKLTRDPDGSLRARLTAPPVDGAANRALLQFLARQLGLKRADLEVVHGTTARDKRIAVHGCSAADLAARIARLGCGPDVDNAERRG